MPVYLVGGAVRDRLLGRPVNERDWVVVGATPEDLMDQGYRQVGASFPVFIHPDSGEEYALARTERKTALGHKGFSVAFDPSVTLEQDLERRDLTINAIAEPAGGGELVDPYHGISDLRQRLLRHVSPAFVEDPLRVLRVARFAAQLAEYDFQVAAPTLNLMRRISASGELETLPAERVWKELWKAMAAPRPSRFVTILRDCGALERLLPEVDALFGVPQTERWHPEVDTGRHLCLALDMAARLQAPAAVVYAVLVHDLGKALTPKDKLPSHHGHDAAGVPLVRAVCERLKAPRRVAWLAEKVCLLHLKCHRVMEMRPLKVLDLIEQLDGFRRPEGVEHFVLACEADARGRLGLEDRPYPQADYLRAALRAAAAVQVADLAHQGLSGPAIAEALRKRRLQALREHAGQSTVDSSQQPGQSAGDGSDSQ